MNLFWPTLGKIPTGMAEKITVRGITRDLAFEIAKRVDNRYMPERDNFLFAPGQGNRGTE